MKHDSAVADELRTVFVQRSDSVENVDDRGSVIYENVSKISGMSYKVKNRRIIEGGYRSGRSFVGGP